MFSNRREITRRRILSLRQENGAALLHSPLFEQGESADFANYNLIIAAGRVKARHPWVVSASGQREREREEKIPLINGFSKFHRRRATLLCWNVRLVSTESTRSFNGRLTFVIWRMWIWRVYDMYWRRRLFEEFDWGLFISSFRGTYVLINECAYRVFEIYSREGYRRIWIELNILAERT